MWGKVQHLFQQARTCFNFQEHMEKETQVGYTTQNIYTPTRRKHRRNYDTAQTKSKCGDRSIVLIRSVVTKPPMGFKPVNWYPTSKPLIRM